MNRYLLILLLFIIIVLIYLYYRNVTRHILNDYDREQIYEFDNLLNPQECNRIIEMARPHLQKSTVLTGLRHPGRTSSHIFLPTTNDLLKKIDQIVSGYLNIPSSHFEQLQVVNYKSTQKYDAHYDTCEPNDPICIADTERFGSLRFATFIIYLNDDFTGGETEFPKHNFKATPKTGKAVLFFNLNNDNTNRRINSFHGGLPPNTGEKWMCNKWIRLKPINKNAQ